MLLYAGITSFSFKYLKISQLLVTILKQRSQSAGNLVSYLKLVNNNLFYFTYFKNYKSSSETLRNNTNINLNKISIHRPSHLKPTNNEDFGYYLAGLIDGAGKFCIKNLNIQLVIRFEYSDASLAYFIKKRLGFGRVIKNENNRTLIFLIDKVEGVIKVINFVKDKIRNQEILDQIKNNICLQSYLIQIIEKDNPIILSTNQVKILSDNSNLQLNINADLNNYWFCGFSDVISNFNIKVLGNIKTKLSIDNISLSFQMKFKDKKLLNVIKNFLGGNIIYNKRENLYYYKTESFLSAYKIINYFDKYHLLSSKYIYYIKWRKTYNIIQDNNHLKINGFIKIMKIVEFMNKN